ncbi:dienelactone hydrolase [Aureobasidium pullulans]|uniref:Dienelactone hydrolase n=1 Tax=Aureobasidium pullulans TaxID=5580 RepID=A0A4S9A4C9_AURPU|nr:dienelactone hydrolase [Aureobasidium pullulans]
MGTATMTARVDASEPFLKHLNVRKTPYIFLTAETDDFDEEMIAAWEGEGFVTTYVPYGDGGKDYVARMHAAPDHALGLSDQYAIVAFGDAASTCLEAYVTSTPRLAALVAYYPSRIPDPQQTRYPMHTTVLVHLVGNEIKVIRTPEVLGIQGKKKIITKRTGDGLGLGGQLKLSFQAYKYDGVEAGFAESDLDEYDAAAASVAWSRSIGVVKKALRMASEIERIRDEHVDHTKKGNISKALAITSSNPAILHAPTLTGGFHPEDLSDFYTEFFQPSPASLNTKLLSRTIGTDRIVDELSLSFNHNKVIPWLLPGIPATNRRIEVVLISIVCVKAGVLESEKVYWDQASVLMQVGLLDPKVVPDKFKEKGVKILPVIGAESARAAVRGGSRRINELIEEW